MRAILLALLVTGCAGGPIAPGPTDTAGTPSPATGVATASPSGDVASSPSARPGAALIDAFVAWSADPQASYRLDQVYRLVVGTATTTTTVHIDRDGANVHLVADRDHDGVADPRAEAIVVGSVEWDRTGDGAWFQRTTPTDTTYTPYAFVDAVSIAFAGQAIDGGRFTQHLTLAAPIDLASPLAETSGVTGGSARLVAFDAFVDEFGHPIEVRFGFDLYDTSGQVAGQGTIQDQYADDGGAITISPPASPSS